MSTSPGPGSPGSVTSTTRISLSRLGDGSAHVWLLGVRGGAGRDLGARQVRGVKDARMVLEVVRGALVANAPPSSTYAAFASEQRELGELLDQEHACAAFRDRLDRRDEPLDDDGREPERELVDEDRARTRDERLCEHDHLLLAAGQEPSGHRPAPLELGEELERVGEAVASLLPRERVRGDAQVVLDRERRQEASAFRDDRNPGRADPLGPAMGEIRVAEQDSPRRRTSTPATASTSVDLPAPFAPSSVVTSPGGISSETSSTTVAHRAARTGPRSAENACAVAQSKLVLGAEVRVDHVLVPQHLGRRGRRDQLAEVEHRRRLAARRHEAHVVVDEDHERTELLRDPRISSPECTVSCYGRPAPGSSSITTRGLPTTVRATSTRRRSRAPSPPTLVLGGIFESDEVDRAQHVGPPRRTLGARMLVDDRHVVVHRQRLDRLLGLERATEAPPRTPEVGHPEEVLTERLDRTGRRLDEAAQHVEERRLAGAVRPDQPARAARERHAHVVERE